MNPEIPKLIGVIDFRNKKVGIYYSSEQSKEKVQSAWQARNPDSYYQGALFRNNQTGKVTYPLGAVIPEQTNKDRESIPKFIVVGVEKLDAETMQRIRIGLNKEYIRHNGNKLWK